MEQTTENPAGTMLAYCFGCKTKKEMRNPEPFVMKNGRSANRGACPDCGRNMFRIGKPA